VSDPIREVVNDVFVFDDMTAFPLNTMVSRTNAEKFE